MEITQDEGGLDVAFSKQEAGLIVPRKERDILEKNTDEVIGQNRHTDGGRRYRVTCHQHSVHIIGSLLTSTLGINGRFYSVYNVWAPGD